MARLKTKRYALAGALITVWKKLCSLREICESVGENRFNGMPEIWACELFIELWNMDNSRIRMSMRDIDRFEKTAKLANMEYSDQLLNDLRSLSSGLSIKIFLGITALILALLLFIFSIK